MAGRFGAWVWQGLRRNPGVSTAVIASLAVGLAANAVMFAVVDAAVLRPFPFPEPDRLVGVGAAYPRLNRALSFFESISAPEFLDVRRESTTLDHVIAFDLNNEAVVIDGEPRRVFTAFAWGDPIDTLGVAPALGRGFTADEVEAAAPVAIISHAFWRSAFGGDAGAIGRQFRLNGRIFDVVGVMPPRTRLYGTDLWVPMADRAETLPRDRRQFNILARLRPGATPERVAGDLDQIAQRTTATFGQAFPEYQGYSLGTEPWTEIDAWSLGGVTWVAFAGTALLLWLVTANLASLLLARAAGRRREAAVRAALGASRARLIGAFLGESIVQTLAGAVVGVGLAWLALQAVQAWAPGGLLPAEIEPVLNPRVLLLVVGAALAAAVLVGLGPALHLARVQAAEILNEAASRTVGARATRRWHAVVVAFEVAAALAVTGAAALLALHTSRLLDVDRGFDSSRLTTMRVTLPVARYDGDRSLAFFDQLLDGIRALPAVEHASASNQPPPGLFSRSQFEIAGREIARGDALPTAFYTTAAAGYRDTIGLRLARGRWFDERAPVTGAREVVVNATLAARYFPGGDPVGQRVRVIGPANDGQWAEIVGVVDDVRNQGLAQDPQPEMIASVRQIPDRRRTQLYVVVRTRTDADRVVEDVRGLVRGLDPEQPIYAISTVADQFESGVAPRRAAADLLGAFCVLAAGLAGLGIFGVLTYAVHERAGEIALRVALGGSRPAIVALVLGQALRPLLAGLAAGALALVLGERFLARWIFGITPEPIVVALAALLLLAVGLAAGLRPAIRASRLSPVEALRR
ncbi:MAG: ADOP family duplicated permease [Vicinamibacterales bacterium]